MTTTFTPTPKPPNETKAVLIICGMILLVILLTIVFGITF